MIASCPDCSWELDVPDAVAEHRLQQHRELRHGWVSEPTVQLALPAWEALADDAVRKAAARGESFLMWEALREFGVPDHPDPKNGMGRYAMSVHRRGLAHPCAFDTSPRPGTNDSSIRRWIGDPAKCSDQEHRGVLVP